MKSTTVWYAKMTFYVECWIYTH